jgi:uncharacterized Zn-finger protein
MTLKNMSGNSWLGRVIHVAWLVSSVIVMFLLAHIDNIVHDQLYDFGLQFSFAWANSYWIAFRLIYVCMAVPSILSVIKLGLDFWKISKSKETPPVKKHASIRKHVPKPVSKPALKAENSKRNSTLISCPSCEKTFSKPMTMLDFSTGKAKLVNACPYCNKILGDANRSEDEKEFETRVLSPEEKTDAKHQRWR